LSLEAGVDFIEKDGEREKERESEIVRLIMSPTNKEIFSCLGGLGDHKESSNICIVCHKREAEFSLSLAGKVMGFFSVLRIVSFACFFCTYPLFPEFHNAPTVLTLPRQNLHCLCLL
jgi:hypothetical protein